MSRINTPINQVKLTNVAVVRSNKGGKRFEIACYRNKVMDFRKGLETDLSEVLQTDRIFTNVGKGQFANNADLQKVFGTKDEEVIARIILEKGQLQVSDLERQAMLESTLAQIATWISRHCVHPQSQRPYTVTQVRHALKDGQYQVQPHKPIKKQYLDCVKFLKGVIPIERAKMELVLSYEQKQLDPDDNNSKSEAEQQLQRVLEEQQEASMLSVVRHQKDSSSNSVTKCTILADPSLYRVLDDVAKLLPQGKLDVLRQVVTQEGDIDLELELERKTQLQEETQKNQQRLQQQQKSRNGHQSSDDDDDDDDGTTMLAKQLKQKAAIHDDDDEDDNESDGKGHRNNDDSDDNDGELMSMPVSRKKQNKQNKKLSKKAKRRQKEEQAEREARLQAEQERQDARNRRNGASTTDDGDDTQTSNQQTSIVEANAATAAPNGDAGKSCNTCGGSFPTAAAYRAHFKSDWHRFNQKLKLQKMAPVSEQEFILCDAESFFGA